MLKKEIKTVIGCEIHAVLDTELKLFSKARNKELEPNKNVDLLDIGMPGALPVLNCNAVIKAVRAALALNMEINEEFSFDRKHYFYPDSPQGYQLTQLYKPIGVNGYLILREAKRIRIKQLHMETDAGKSMHVGDKTLIDYNRCGCPLVEIVTEPDLESAEEVIVFLQLLRSSLRYSEACKCHMELGGFRVDVNISIDTGEKQSKRVEIKNLNSEKAIRRAIEFEQERQLRLLENDSPVQQECRLFNGSETVFMRFKETQRDYMYFPEPDLPAFKLEENVIQNQKQCLGENLPEKLVQRFMKQFNLTYEDAFRLIEEKEIYLFISAALLRAQKNVQEIIIKLVKRCVFRKLNEGSKINISPEELRSVAESVEKYKLNALLTEQLFNEVWDDKVTANDFIKREGLDQMASFEEISKIVQEVLEAHEKELKRYLAGEDKLRGLFVGKVMKQFANKADPKLINETIDQKIKSYL